MSHLVIFGAGVLVGVVYEKSLRAWKSRIERAARAATAAMKD